MAQDQSRRLETRHTISGGEPLDYADIGSGEPVLWLFPFHAPLWVHWNLSGSRGFVQEVARHYRLILVDDRHKLLDGLEERQPVPENYLSGLVADTIAALDAAGVDRCHVVASLMTSIPAVALAARHPERVESLLLWDGLLSGPDVDRSEPVRKMMDLVWDDDADVANRSWVGISGLVGDADDAHEYKKVFNAMEFRPVRDRVAVRGLGASDVRSEAFAVHCRTLVVLPNAAVIPGRALTEATARAIPGARLVRVRGAAISPDMEAHAVSLPVVLDWLSDDGSLVETESAAVPTTAADGAVAMESAGVVDDGQSPLDRESESQTAELSERELEVLRLVVLGMTNPQIAERLTIAPSTVARHVHNILGKTGLSNRTQLADYAHRAGLLDES